MKSILAPPPSKHLLPGITIIAHPSIEFGLVKYPLPHVNMLFNGEGCVTIVLLYIYTESVKKKL